MDTRHGVGISRPPRLCCLCVLQIHAAFVGENADPFTYAKRPKGPGFAGVAEVGVPDDAGPIEFESRPKSTTQHKGSDATLKDGAVPGIPPYTFYR